MDKIGEQELLQELKHLQATNASLLIAIPLIHFMGYGFLTLTFLNLIYILIPLNLFDPFWRLDVLKGFIDQIPIALIGAVCIFYGGSLYRSQREKIILQVLHNLVLGYGIVFLLLIPLGIIDTSKIYQANSQKNQFVAQEKILAIQANKEKILTTKTTADLANLLETFLAPTKIATNTSEKFQLEPLRNQVLDIFENQEQQIKQQMELANKNRFAYLVKNSLKFNLGSLTTAILFLNIWRCNKWVKNRIHNL